MISKTASRRIRRQKMGFSTFRRTMKAAKLRGQLRRRVEVYQITGQLPREPITGKFLGFRRIKAKLATMFGRQQQTDQFATA